MDESQRYCAKWKNAVLKVKCFTIPFTWHSGERQIYCEGLDYNQGLWRWGECNQKGGFCCSFLGDKIIPYPDGGS